jgi:drug/metabolite transporter (DMT)-like permease
LDTRRKYMAIVLFSALVVAAESVGVEAAINTFGVGSYTVACVPSIVAGIALLLMTHRPASAVARSLGGRGWLFMVATCGFIAGGVLMWFDAVGRIGASKEAILGGGSSEVLFIVLLSVVFLSERLTRLEAIGSALVLTGVFIILFNTDTVSLSVGFGEVEAILSSVLLAVSVIMTAVLLRSHSLVPVSGMELLVSGGLLLAVGVPFGLVSVPSVEGLLVIVSMGCFPAVGIVTYYAGLPKIGASLTSVLFALTGVMTVGVQLMVLAAVPGSEMILPQNLGLAVTGGVVAFVGVYLLNSGQAKATEPPPDRGRA